MRALGLLVLGLGLGLGAGYLAGAEWGSPAVVWLALGLVVLSSVPLALGSRGTPGLVRGRPAGDPEKPAPADLGNRVEAILDLAEGQAADTIRAAEAEAERQAADTVRAAEAEAERIVAEARAAQLPD